LMITASFEMIFLIQLLLQSKMFMTSKSNNDPQLMNENKPTEYKEK
jgi:hypothetical protein